VDSRDRLPLIHEQPSSQKQSHQEREKNQQNQTKKDFESTEPTFRIENREKKSREIDRRSSCTSECLSSLVSSTRKSRAGVDVAGTFDFGFDVYALWEKKRPVLSCTFIFILFGFWIMILEQAALTHDIERIFRSKKLFKTTKAPSSTWLHRHHKQPGHLWGWTDPPPPQGRTCTTAEQLGRVRRVKVKVLV